MRTELNFWQDYYEQLRGAVIMDVGIDEVDDYGCPEYYPCFIVKLKNGKQIQIDILMDPEGNGPGFIEGLPHVKPAGA